MLPENPCLTCGACCAHFRVSFYWTEADPEQGGEVPVEMTEPLPPHRVYMRGTNQVNARCAALVGAVGSRVACAIYNQRPSPCREFGVQWEEDAHQTGQGALRFEEGELERCNRARKAHGLPEIALEPVKGPAEAA